MTAQDKNVERPIGAVNEDRLARLAHRDGGLALADAANFAWQDGPRLPSWLSRRFLAGIVADLRYGETVTARACGYMSDLLQDSGTACMCLAVQAADEQAHADLYGRYLSFLDFPSRANPGLEEIFRRCLDWRGHPVALVLAFNVVLEGDALRLQLYVPARLAGLDTEQRVTIFRWLRALWWETSDLVLDGLRGPAVAGYRLLRGLVRAQTRSLAPLGG